MLPISIGFKINVKQIKKLRAELRVGYFQWLWLGRKDSLISIFIFGSKDMEHVAKNLQRIGGSHCYKKIVTDAKLF